MTSYNPEYARKIKTCEELLQVVGKRPRSKKVIMCHGMFDIVHPGHLRHLTYAKEKADILVVALTADGHNEKANLRPYVPQDLRALNLAALEMVNFVIIDSNSTPVENIKFLQPDFFAKGYEYFSNGLPPKTQEEIATLESYGGEMVFTPGDIIYSSSTLIENHPPKLWLEKLLALMRSEDVTFCQLKQTLQNLRQVRVHVVGDTIVDSYSYCSLLGATAKSPTFSVKHDHTDVYSGGAAIVAKHMRETGAQVTFSTVLGDDALKDFVVEDMKKAGIHFLPIIDHNRLTTNKERFISGNYKMLQVDRVDNRPINFKMQKEIVDMIQGVQADVVVFSDFRHGIFNKQTTGVLQKGIPNSALSVADSQVSNRWGNILDFMDFDLITPNEREARFALADQDSIIRPLASELFRRARCNNLILKLGERGLMTCRSSSYNPREFFTIDSFAHNVIDPIGAGDALLAYAALSLKATGNIVISSILGAVSAAVTCERNGNLPVKPQEAIHRLDEIERKANFS